MKNGDVYNVVSVSVYQQWQDYNNYCRATITYKNSSNTDIYLLSLSPSKETLYNMSEEGGVI